MPSFTTIALYLLCLLLLLAAAGGAYMYRSMFMATRGKRIAPYPQPRRALLVLDIQEGYVGGSVRQPVTAPPPGSMLDRVNRLIEWAAANDIEVAYVRQVFANNLFVRLHGGHRQGEVILDRRLTLINGNDFAKNRTDAFANRDLEQLLIRCQVNELLLVGVDAAYCVYYTALGGLQRGYRVRVVQDAVRSRKPLAEVLARYQRKGIDVVSSEDLLGG